MNDAIEIPMVDISAQTYGKYQYTTKWKVDGMFYADSDFELGGGGAPKAGACPDPEDQDTQELLAKARLCKEPK